MRPRLIMRLPARQTAGHLEWVALDNNGRSEGGSRQGTPAEAAADALGRQVLGLADGLAVLLSNTVIPSRNRERVRRAVPFALEERLAGDVDSLHFALGRRESGGRVRVAVLERGWLAGWEQTLADAGVLMEQIYPEVLALPLQPDAWTVLVDSDRFLIRTGDESGFGGDADNLAALLKAALAEAVQGAPERLVVYRTAQTPPRLPDSAPAAEHYTILDSLALLAAHLDPTRAIRLGTGAGASGADTQARLRRWRLPAAMALALLALATGQAWLAQWELARRSEQLQASIEATFQRAFPNTPVRSPRMQMENRLAALRGASDGGFLGLLNAVAPAVTAVEHAQITALSFRAGSLELEVTIDSLQSVQALEQRLAATGNLGVEVAGAEAQGKLVRARLLLEAAP